MQNKKLPKYSPNEITKLVMAYMEALKKKIRPLSIAE